MVLLMLLVIVGAYAAAWWLLENVIIPLAGIGWNSLKLWLSGSKSLSERYGQWAVITGATDGIGKAYALQLARKGMNLVLISRSEAKLMKVSREIKIATGVKIKLIAADFSDGEAIYENIRQQLEPFDVGILVNNVGMFVDSVDLFENHPQKLHIKLINVNAVSMILMTHLVLPGMKKARRGIIINISSNLAMVPGAYVTSYTASKSYGHSFTLALQQELRGSGVECQLVVPGFVRTNLIEPLSLANLGGKLLPDADQFAASATWLIGRTDFTAGHWFQAVQNTFSILCPAALRRRICAAIFRSQISRRDDSAKRTSL